MTNKTNSTNSTSTEDDLSISPVQTTQYGWIWVGIGCAVIGSFFISLGLVIQRLAHKNNTNGIRYTRIPLWWLGLLFMAGGEIGNFLAYGMAPASMVSPLGAVTVISNAVLSRVFLKERLSWTGLFGVLLALIGATLVALNAPTAEIGAAESGDARGPASPERVIYDSLISWRTFAYLIVVVLLALFIANPLKLPFAVSNEYAKTHVICYCFLCGLMGAITVMSAKGISTAINQALAGQPAMFVQADICWLTYILILSAAGSIVMQMRYLNEALINFASSLVVPVYYIVFTIITITTGMVVFLEISFDPLVRCVVLFVLGLILAFLGVYLINSQSAGEGEKPTSQETAQAVAGTVGSREDLEVIFAELDKNKSGDLDQKELEALVDALGERWRAPHFLEQLMKKMDADGSGGVSFDEFERWYHDDYGPQALTSAERIDLHKYAETISARLKIADNVLAAIGTQVQKLLDSSVRQELTVTQRPPAPLMDAVSPTLPAVSNAERGQHRFRTAAVAVRGVGEADMQAQASEQHQNIPDNTCNTTTASTMAHQCDSYMIQHPTSDIVPTAPAPLEPELIFYDLQQNTRNE